MSTLFVTGTWPAPLAEFTHGIAQRIRLLLSALADTGEPLHLLAFGPPSAQCGPAVGTALRGDFASLWGIELASVTVAARLATPASGKGLWRDYLLPMTAHTRQPAFAPFAGAALARSVAECVRAQGIDRLFIHRLAAHGPVSRSAVRLPALMDLDDVEHLAFERLVRQPPHWGAKRLMLGWLPSLRAAERRAISSVDRALVCSELDRRYLAQRWGLDNVSVVPNAVRDMPVSPIPGAERMLFLGLHSYAPNRIAAEYLLQHIWPRVRARRPAAELVIAGKGCELIAGFGARTDGVTFAGYVPDLAGLYAQTRIVLCPLLSGGGTRIKIIEAALQARPVVSTAIGAEGLALRPDRHEIVIADEPDTFADQIVALLEQPARAEAMGRAAREAALGLYGEDTVRRAATAEFKKWIGSNRSARAAVERRTEK